LSRSRPFPGENLKPFNSKGEFPDRVNSDNVRQLAARGAGMTLFSGGLGLAVQIIAVVVLARLLVPKDFGLVTMVTTFSLLFSNFGLNGLTEAIVQRSEINHRVASNLFWVNVAGSALLAVAFAGAASLLAGLYKDPRVTGVAKWLALSIFLTGLQVIHLALLKRAMKFSVVSANDIVARAVSIFVSIWLAWMGWGYWALVAGAIALPASTCVGAWMLCRWMPGLPRRATGTGSMVRFAIHTYGRFFTGYFSNNLDNFLVGWRLGPTQLGFYKKAYDLFVLPSGQLSIGLTIVAVSALSRLQRDLAQYKRYLLSALGVMAFVGMGISADLTLVGRDLILVLLGPKWGESGQLFTLFAPGIGFMLLYCTHIWIHLSLGNANRWFRWGIVDLIVTTVFLVTGLHWQAKGIAVAWVASYWIITLPALWYAGKPIDLGISSVITAIWKYVLASVMAGYATFLITNAIQSLGASAGVLMASRRVVIVSAVFSGVYLGTVILLCRGCEPLYQLVRLVREMTSWGKLSAPASVLEQGVHGAEVLHREVLGTPEISKQSLSEIG
jgi:O-antigen/teichoic acid export membrane protein